VIAQRNISLLSNRLAADGGARIREDEFERDYCLAWFLCGLAESDLKPVLAFKAGTDLTVGLSPAIGILVGPPGFEPGTDGL
jgi:hypothetical protein